MGDTASAGALWPFWVYAGGVLVLILGMMILSFLLGGRRMTRATRLPYEGGVPSTESARVRFSINFYLTAIFFVIFDLESVFIFAYAITARDVGWPGYVSVSVFTLLLLAALVYLVKTGALDYVRKQRARPQRAAHLKETP